MTIDLDRPILGDKHSPDLLNRLSFARRIAKILDLPKGSPGLVVSLEGRWGCGKTSVLNMVEGELPGQGNTTQSPIVFKFNPWLIGDRDFLIQAFLEELASELDISTATEKGKSAAKKLLGYARWLRYLKYVPDPTGVVLQAVSNVAEGMSQVANDLNVQDRPSLAANRKLVKEALEALDVCVIVLMDDIDRLPPKEVFEVFRLVKAVADFPNTAYLLSYDQSYVVNALCQSLGRVDAHEFLEKIVQLRIAVPELRTDQIQKLIMQEFCSVSSKILGAVQGETSHLQELIDTGLIAFFENVRDIRRVFNRVRIDEPGCRGHVGLADLVALSTIAIKLPKLFAHIKAEPWLYSHGVTDPYNEIVDRDQTYDEEERKRSEINKELQPRFQAAARSLIRKLFPRTKKDIIGNHDFNELRAQGRIGLHEFLATALCSSLSDHEFELSKAQDFVEKPEGREKLLKEVIEGKKYIVFCDLISAVCSRSLPRDRFEFCLSISRLLSSIENPQPHWNNQSENRIAWAVWKIIKFIFDSTELGTRDILLKKLYETPSLIYIKGRIAHELFCTDTNQNSPWGHSLVVMRWTSSEILTRWRDEMQKLCKQVDFFSMFCSGKLFWIYATTNPEEAKLVLTSVQPGDSLYDALWKGIANHIYSSSGEVFVHFDVPILSNPGDPELHRENAKKRLESEPLDDETKYILQAIISGKKISLSNGSVMD